MPTLHRLGNMTIRINTPDHLPPHVHVVLSDRRDAQVDIETLKVTSRTVNKREIIQALVWIAQHRAHAIAFFKECNP